MAASPALRNKIVTCYGQPEKTAKTEVSFRSPAYFDQLS
jgi:hypothetical protein